MVELIRIFYTSDVKIAYSYLSIVSPANLFPKTPVTFSKLNSNESDGLRLALPEFS